MSAVLTQPLRDEHRELLPHVEQLRVLGDAAGERRPDVQALREAALDFLQRHLLVHAYAEEQVLYPVVAEAMGAPDATATMRRDHTEVEHLVRELAGVHAVTAGVPSDQELATVRRVAYGLYALLQVHFAKEEEIYLPLLDSHLSGERATRLFADMERAATARRTAA